MATTHGDIRNLFLENKGNVSTGDKSHMTFNTQGKKVIYIIRYITYRIILADSDGR